MGQKKVFIMRCPYFPVLGEKERLYLKRLGFFASDVSLEKDSTVEHLL